MSSSRSVIKSGKGVQTDFFSAPEQNLFRPSRRSRLAQRANVETAEIVDRGYEPLPGEKLWLPPKEEAAEEDAEALEDAGEKPLNVAAEELEAARREAEAILKEAREKAEELEKEAFDQAFKEGYTEGFRQGTVKADQDHNQALQEQLESFQQDIEKALSSVEEAKKRSLRNYMEELKECAIAVAEKVIHISIRSSGDIIRRMIIAETEKLKKTAWVKIYMEKTDYELMMESDADVIEELSRLSDNIKFIVMDKNDPGSCIIEMPEEIVDISVDTQLQNIREILGTIKI